MTLDSFNALTHADAKHQLLGCCHCQQWATALANMRPFESLEQLLQLADQLWLQANEAQILEAFSGHARIGDIELLRSKYAGRATGEQGQVLAASDDVLNELQRLNDLYFEKNQFIFIVCASGKPAHVMLELLQQRIHNCRDTELQNGAVQQGYITRLRLQQLFISTNAQARVQP
ncbi:2-oxo-4-hydroxy-4-carboxy-5-ureidoimidazoline decarboxylase [Echinimonas agarilytica]|uniref:2-oxo-4-hydroxy-4-carboxy-5-ureidoimidazoline decarboxylase n=1 Tax=Echinimonas agarilytica TaxID=1215918 RepID=A0AA41W704_9GAMM|nr:2-oxo-4-hydroxy-4-carboxy-5-ureidoimidazoline decarboxylase [Echinimonas agarilytica]MCM2680217.1 2-oxo-4-hydroxy-4-carboxy-5-ureidoimidazoline decarboxylase [Echinimonas agarilytica]